MKKRTGDPWMSSAEYSRGLRGLGLNLLVRGIDTQVRFLTEVLNLDVVYADPDIAVFRHQGSDLILHADHTYDKHPLLPLIAGVAARGAGAELRVYGVDPDAACRSALERGFRVIEPATDKGHGLRESFIEGPDGYIWVPSQVA